MAYWLLAGSSVATPDQLAVKGIKWESLQRAACDVQTDSDHATHVVEL